MFLQLEETHCCLFEEGAEKNISSVILSFLSLSLLFFLFFTPAGNPPNKKKRCGGVSLRAMRCSVAIPWGGFCLIVREGKKKKKEIRSFKCWILLNVRQGSQGKYSRSSSTHLLWSFSHRKKATHADYSQCCSVLFTVLLYYSKMAQAVTHTPIVVQSTLPCGLCMPPSVQLAGHFSPTQTQIRLQVSSITLPS